MNKYALNYRFNIDNFYLRLDGTTVPSANISFNNNRQTNLAAPINSLDSANAIYVGLQSMREIEYNYIASHSPVFWLSSYYYDGIRPKSSQTIVTLTGQTKDIIGNTLTQTGTVQIKADSSN